MKWALIHLGSDLAYGMTFFAGELIKNKQNTFWFDGDNLDIDKLKQFNPDYVCFGPLSSEFESSIKIANQIKKELPNILTVFGGHHVKAVPEELDNYSEIDYIIWGPCYDVIDKIINSKPNTLIKGSPVDPSLMFPDIENYYTQIPRIGNRPRTYIMSHFGCAYNCSFCCTDVTRKAFGVENYKKYWMTRRPVDNIINEAKISKKFGMKEIGLNDDDFLYGTNTNGTGISWIKEFASKWKTEIDLPMYVNVTPKTVLRSDPEALKILSTLVKTVQMGLETFDEGSKKVFNRSFQNEEQLTQACDKLTSLGLKVKLEIIIGLPNIDGLVPDPLEDAIHTLQACQRLAKTFPGKIKAQCNNLVLYPGTRLWNKCVEKDIPRRETWKNALYESRGSIVFTPEVEKQIRNIVKMATMFVKFNIDEEWVRAIISMNLTNESSKKFSECNYKDSLVFRLGDQLNDQFNNIIKNMTFKY